MGADEKHAATYHGGEYTPDEKQLRNAYLNVFIGERNETSNAEFDRAITKIKAEAKAEALQEAADALNPELINYRRDAMEALSQPIRPAGGDGTMSLQLALVAANRTAVWLRARANQYKENQS